MNNRPKLQRSALMLPSIPGHNDALWEALLQLARTEALQEWTLIGGQMVPLHALEHGTTPIRLSTDIDVVVNARVVAGRRERASIDVLAPEGLGNRADLTTTPPSRTLEVDLPGYCAGCGRLAALSYLAARHLKEAGNL